MSRRTAVGCRVTGMTHILRGTVCQDALRVEHGQQERFLIAAVADGHGSDRCPYSDEGAEAAVQTAVSALKDVLEGCASSEAYAALAAQMDIRLPKQIEAQWKVRVTDIHKEKGRPDGGSGQGPFSFLFYGSTLLAVAVAEGFLFALQIGDGDIMMIDGKHQAGWLIPPEYTADGETYSLCMDESWQYMRAHIRPLPEDGGPLMLMLATDGYANSFADAEGFKQAGRDIYALWLAHGTAYLEEHLEDWLTASSADGSGDDITAALVLLE